MRKIFLIFGALCAAFAASAQEPFVIEGHVPALADSTEVLLYLDEGSMLRPVDTAYVAGGRFRFSYPLEQPAKMALIGRWTSRYLPIWAEPGITVRISGEDDLLYTWQVKSPVAHQQQQDAFKQAAKALHKASLSAEIKNDSLRKVFKKAESDEERNRIREQGLRQKAIVDSLQYLLYERELALLTELNPASSLIFVDELWGIGGMIFHYPERYGELKERAITQYNRLTDSQKASERGQETDRFLHPPKQVGTGEPMADAELADLDGVMHKLSDYQGKYILLDFWAAWCGPCRAAMPELAEMAKEYADRLTIIGINSDTQHSIWAEASAELGITWVNLSAPGQSEIAAKYQVNGIPHQVIVSPEGVVLGAWMGYGKGHIREQLKKYIPENN